MRYCIILFFSSLLSLFANAESVAVIGAGPAGLAAAEKLQSNGFDVTIFEKDPRIGGKCYSIDCEDDHGIVELGAVQVGIGYPIVNRYVEETGLHLRDYWPSSSLRWSDDNKPIYQTFRQEYWPVRDSFAIARELFVMRNALKRFAEINDSDFDYFPPNSEFMLPFETWADQLGLDHFKEDYRVWMTSYGYGLLSEVPTYLALSLINSSFGLYTMRTRNMNLRMIAEGYGGLMHAMVYHYHLNVKSGVNVTEIDRTDDNVTVHYNERGRQHKVEKFDHLVVACGLSCINEFFSDDEMTKEERKLVQDMVFSPYDVVIADVPELPKGGYVVPQNLHEYGRVSLISKNSAGGNEVILWVPRGGQASVDRSIPRPSEEKLRSIVEEDMARFGFTVKKIVKTQYWDTYFPHFGNADSYHLLHSIQGKNRTIYVGSMARFEIVERAMSHAHDMVGKHLLGETVDNNESILGSMRSTAISLSRYYRSMSKSASLK